MPTLPTNPNRQPPKPRPGRYSGERSKAYDSRTWRRTRAYILAQEPLCRSCMADGKHEPATMVDHIQPIREGGAMFDLVNLQPLCNQCHQEKTWKETGEVHRKRSKRA